MAQIKIRRRHKGDYEVVRQQETVVGWIEWFTDGWRFFPDYGHVSEEIIEATTFKEAKEKTISQIEELFGK